MGIIRGAFDSYSYLTGTHHAKEWSRTGKYNHIKRFLCVQHSLSFVVVIYMIPNGWFQVVGEAKNGEVVGEIGMLCYRPQPFTVRTKRLSQLLRLNRTAFLNIVQANVGDGTIIINNLLQVSTTSC